MKKTSKLAWVVFSAIHGHQIVICTVYSYTRHRARLLPSVSRVSKMAKSLAKVQKKISKKKRKINSLHENSRDSQKLRRAGARSEKLERVSAARAKANKPHRKPG